MGKNIKVSPAEVRKLAEECKNLAESLNFNDPIISETKITKKINVRPIEDSLRYKNLFEYSIPSDDDRDNLAEVSSESDIYKQIVADLESELNQVAEMDVLEEGVLDVIRKYAGKKMLTVAIIAQLMATGKVTAQQLGSAGVEPEKIEVAMDKMDTDKQGRPEYFNFVNVKAWATPADLNQEGGYEMYAGYDFSTFQSSSYHNFVNVPYTITSSKEMAKTSEYYGMGNFTNYNKYTEKSISDTTAGSGEDFYIVGSGDKDEITYTVSNYPMEFTDKNGDILKFIGAQINEAGTLRKNSFINTEKGDEAARLGGSNKFYEIKSSSFSIKANSASIVLVYGKGGTEDKAETPTPSSVEMKSGSLYGYNSTDVNTNSADYQQMLKAVTDSITKNPDAGWVLNVKGSSSQVPTNYPSMSGEKTIEANKVLAHDRAKAFGIQLLKDLKSKGIDVSKINKGKIVSAIGDAEFQNDPSNVARYAPDQYVEFSLTPAGK